MSKQPGSANTFMSRLRRPAGRLRDMPIWSKLGLIMIVPIIATVVVGTSGLLENVDTLNTASRARALAELTAASGELVDSLQDERAAAVLVLGAGKDGKDREKHLQTYQGLHQTVDAAKAPYSQRRTALVDLPTNLNRVLGRTDESLADLPAVRSQVVNASLPLSEASRAYEGLISDLLDIRDSAAQLAGDSALSDRMRAGAATARAKEWLSIRRVVVHRALIDQSLTPALRNQYIATETGLQQALQTFKAVANAREAELYDQTVAGPDQRVAQTYNGYIMEKTSADMQGAPFDAAKWDSAMAGNGDLIRDVEAQLDANTVDLATSLRNDVQRQVFIETGVLLGTLLLAILFAWLVARSMARSLRELRHGALSVAQYGLPQAVARLRDPQISGQLSPIQVANQIAEPLPVRSRDEFGQVTEAFNAVHLEAVRTAAEQAALRSSVATMFVNLARRSQILVDRLIGHLDRLERGEEDPDRLAELFQLDHLATRMRRNDENLLVLAGADSTRVQREPAALIDVLRASQSEVEHYTRIEFGSIDRDVEISAHAVNDLVHLVAELFDNATAFSPPDSQVLVEARRVGDRAVLFVEDRGIGISADQLQELNERLATPPMVDVAVSRMMGLVVVARLAARHGVGVELRPAADRGTVAEVTLPTPVLVSRALAGRTRQPAAAPAAMAPPQRPPDAAPLALESGPAGARAEGNGLAAAFGARPFEPAPLNGGGAPDGAGRPLPSWADLTGAAQGGTGAGQFSPRPTTRQGTDPLPRRRGTEQEPVEGQPTGAGSGPLIPRQLPTSPEAQGPANGASGAMPATGASSSGMPLPPPPPLPGPPPMSGPFAPLPPVSGPPVSGPPVSGPPVSGPPLPGAPLLRPPGSEPFTYGPPAAAGPPASSRPPAPPAWPPVAVPGPDPAQSAETDRETAPPPVPEKLAAALDLTAELPRVVRRSPEPTPPPPAAETRPRFVDETMELPIFRELESAWFRTGRSTPEEFVAAPPPATGASDPGAVPRADASRGTGTASQKIPTGSSTMANKPTSGGRATSPRGAGASDSGSSTLPAEPLVSEWTTVADEGWRAASAAAEREPSDLTEAGLPKRVPMAQLVPGGVDKPATSVQRRTPESVRGLLSAYHRGVQRGRTHPKDDNATSPGATPSGPSQTGPARRADSGQKEQK